MQPAASIFTGIPVIDLSDLSSSKTLLVEACQEFGFFKVINHGVSKELMIKLEDEATKFFNLPLNEKEKAASPNPLGYGNKRIGRNGDMGWVEYLLFSANTRLISPLLYFSMKAQKISGKNINTQLLELNRNH
ncbi:unnamed protein product [Thlaspi arvense]|uniref:Non-haem dioxygenase N-terminal domain-containing protein n=1 Tax=Thlaspi arvense TaxID=13288 RepID=A0AAU9SM23_THLAR|nr:unnamed protein product [Thlaspi arvense]